MKSPPLKQQTQAASRAVDVAHMEAVSKLSYYYYYYYYYY